MLQGERVTLRAIEREELPLLWAYSNDLDLAVASGGFPPMPQSLARMQAEFDQRAAQGGGDDPRFGIEVAGKLIGGCGLFGFEFSGDDRTAELGIRIGDKAYWGRGYGREAVTLLLDYAFRLRNWRKVWLRVRGNNERAIRAYRACGFIEAGRQREQVWSAGAYYDLVLMGILRDEWAGWQEGLKAEG